MQTLANLKTIVGVAIGAIVLILGVLAYNVFRTPAEASTPITAIPLAANPSNSPSASSSTSAAPESTAPAASTEPTALATAEAASPAAAVTNVPEADASSGTIVAEIVPNESEARFIIDEVLNNAPKTVIGTTNQVAGEIAVDPQDPTKTRVGTIQINARTLVTDSEFRDRAIKNRILNTDQYEFVTFTPTQINGLPESGSVGQSYTFQIVGDLTVRDVTRQVTFDVTATPVSETRLEGTANTTIRYADWNITIPQVRQVASVSDEVRLEIDFVAVPK